MDKLFIIFSKQHFNFIALIVEFVLLKIDDIKFRR
jgi:hypothetical protein